MPLKAMAQCIISMLKNIAYIEGREATLIMVLKQKIEEKAHQILLPTLLYLFNNVKEQLAVLRWRWLLGNPPLGI